MMRLVLAVVGAWLAVAAFADDGSVLRLEPGGQRVSLAANLSVYRDPSAQLSFGQVGEMAFAGDFRSTLSGHPHFGFTGDAVWVRFALRSEAQVPKEWLVELGHSRFERVDWFVVRNGRLAGHLEAGNLRPRPAGGMRGRFPVLPLTMDPGETVEVYLWLRTSAVVKIPLHLYSPLAYAGKSSLDDMVYYGAFGAFGVLFAMGFIFAVFARYRGSLAYSLSIGSVALLFFGLSGYWAALGLPGWRFGVTNGLLCFNELSLVALLMYLRRFFDTPVRLPRTDRWLKGFQSTSFSQP